MCDWVVCQSLDSIIMAVLQDALQLAGPDDDTFVRTSACKPLAILSIVDTVDRVLVTLEWLDKAPIRGIIHQDPLACSHHQLRPIRSEAEIIDALLIPITIMDFVHPTWNSPHCSCVTGYFIQLCANSFHITIKPPIYLCACSILNLLLVPKLQLWNALAGRYNHHHHQSGCLYLAGEML